MMTIGGDYHPRFQTIAFLMEETGEYGEQELNHSDGEAEKFYRELKQRGISVRVGMEATGYSRWFERLLAELENLPFGCTGCGEVAGTIRSWSSSVRTRESS